MPATRVRYDKETLENSVRSVEKQFPEQIERIRYSVGEDWAGEPAMFFRVLVKDEAIPPPENRELRSRALLDLSYVVRDLMRKEIDSDDFQPYFSFRMVSEQNEMREPRWE